MFVVQTPKHGLMQECMGLPKEEVAQVWIFAKSEFPNAGEARAGLSSARETIALRSVMLTRKTHDR